MNTAQTVFTKAAETSATKTKSTTILWIVGAAAFVAALFFLAKRK